MKRFKLFIIPVIVILFSLLAVGCSASSPRYVIETSKIQEFFGGTHELRKLMPFASQEGYIQGSAGFFLVVGGGDISGETSSQYEVKFAWESNVDDTYIVSSLPLERIRVQLREDADVPTVKFSVTCLNEEDKGGCGGYKYHRFADDGQQAFIDSYVNHAVITVKPEHWPTNIQMPLNEN